MNTTPDNYLEMYQSEENSRAAGSIGLLPTIPAGSVKLERFEDYAYSPDASRRTSVMKIEASTTARSVASLSTDINLARRMNRSLGINITRNNHPSMFDQAFIHSRDLQ